MRFTTRAVSALLVSLCFAGVPALAQPQETSLHSVYETANGQAVIALDLNIMESIGLSLSDPDGSLEGLDRFDVSFQIPQDSRIELISIDRNFATFSGGEVAIRGNVELSGRDGSTLKIRNPKLVALAGTGGAAWSVIDEGREIFRFFSTSLVELDTYNGRMHWGEVEVSLGDDAAMALGLSEFAGDAIGTFTVEAVIAPTGRAVGAEAVEESPVPMEGRHALGGIGPDVIVGDLPATSNWGAVGGIRAYSVGTTSCNIGDTNLDWISGNNRHPVIGQNLYRLKDGRFEMIGQSWLKHGFFALSGSLCFNDCQGTSGSQLGVHCSDPYSSGLNGSRGGLGPKYQVNATNGDFTYPPTQPSSNSTIGRRLQVQETDVNPALNSGASYFVEGHYVTPDDATSGNGLNNASYREAVVTGGSFNLSLTGTTVRELAAINAWPVHDPPTGSDLMIADKQDIPSDGRFTIVSKATELGGGMWHYEYAVHNLNSHRSARSFSIPLPSGANVTNVGFHDVDYHSGEPFDGTDWAVNIASDSITWSTDTFATNANANALRWGTMYNFRFDCDCPPDRDSGTLGLFRTGAPNSTNFTAAIPENIVLLENVLAGNVNAAVGPVEDVLTVNGSAGTGPEREVPVNIMDPISVDIGLPSSQNGSACYVVYVYSQCPTQSSITELPFGLGDFAHRTPFAFNPNSVDAARQANTFAPRHDGILGADNWPGTVRAKAPTNLLNLPQGLVTSRVLFFQGLIVDRNSLQGQVAITNGVKLSVQ